jgi:hypothetical protein
MAKLSQPASALAVKQMIGILDYYCWKGLHVVRAWPRKPRQPNTPAQLAVFKIFEAARRNPLRKLPEQHALTATLGARPHGTLDQYATILALRAGHAGSLFSPIYPHTITRTAGAEGDGVTLTLEYQKKLVGVPEKTLFTLTNTATLDSNLAWREHSPPPSPGKPRRTYYVLPNYKPSEIPIDVIYYPSAGAVEITAATHRNDVELLAWWNQPPDGPQLIWHAPAQTSHFP